MKPTRTLIIGLDGATLDLIQPWAQAGHLPAFARLMDEGVQGTLQAWPNLNSAAAWTSMVTGCNPGQHGIYGFGRPSSQDGTTWRPVSAADCKRDPFWRLLSAAGERVGVVNVPLTYPAEAVNGFMLSGSDASGLRRSGLAHPAGLLEELRDQGIEHILHVPNLAGLSKRAPRQVPLPLQQMVTARARSILHLMRTQPWDVLMAVFIATDRVQHYFWPGERVPLDDPAWMPIRHIYQQIDAFLQDALTLVGQDTAVLVVSDHGFGPPRPVLHHLNTLLAQLGLVHFRGGGASPGSSTAKRLLVWGRRWIPLQLQGSLARAFPGLHLRAMNEPVIRNIEWARTQAFVSSCGGQLHINLQGREPAGIVPPQAYQPLRDGTQAILCNLRDPRSDLRVAQAVRPREDVYHGPYAHLAADLLIRWKEGLPYDALSYEAEGESVIVRAPDDKTIAEGEGRWSGAHRPEGVFLAWGPCIRRGATIEGVTLYDIAPTVLYLHNHPIPRDMDGHVLIDIFN